MTQNVKFPSHKHTQALDVGLLVIPLLPRHPLTLSRFIYKLHACLWAWACVCVCVYVSFSSLTTLRSSKNKLFVLSKFPFRFFLLRLALRVLCVHDTCVLPSHCPCCCCCCSLQLSIASNYYYSYRRRLDNEYFVCVCVCDGCMWKGQLDVFLLVFSCSLLPW